MDAPMQWTKQIASHFGGTRNGLVISWPGHIKDKGGLRPQFCHVIDIVPTIYEAAGIKPPVMMDGTKQKPLDGVSLVYTFANRNAPTRHSVQYFEMFGNRAIYKDDWMASTTPLRLPWVTSGSEPNPDDFKWELYNVGEDFSQANNLAEKNPAKLKELQAAFDVEAKKYNVYPLDSSFAERADPAIRPRLTRGRQEFTYYPGMIRIPEGSAPDFKNKSWAVAAEVAIPPNGASGVLATMGGRYGGWGLLLNDSKPGFVYAMSNQPQDKYRIASDQALSPGNHVVRLTFKYDGGGIGKSATGTLFVDGNQVAQGQIARTVPIRFSLDETFDVGEDTGTPVVEDYVDKMPYRFSGTLKKFVVVLEPQTLTEEERQRLLREEAQPAPRFNENPAALRWIEARVLAELGNQPEAVLVRDDFGNFKVDYPLGTRKVTRSLRIPVDGCASSELKGPSAVEVDEQQSGAWVNRQIAKGVEHVVAVVIRKRDASIVEYLDEPRVSSLVGCIRSRIGVFGRDEGRVGAENLIAILRREFG
jgi:arylsulfatase